ncbi:MAG: hypothetical protein ACFFBS_06285 [Promethearchaeota archaeon]
MMRPQVIAVIVLSIGLALIAAGLTLGQQSIIDALMRVFNAEILAGVPW